LPDSAKAEAAVWVARLHSDARSEQTEARFRLWLAASPVHRDAFERMTRVWDATANLRRQTQPELARSRELWRAVRRATLACAATLAVCVLMISAVRFFILPRDTPGALIFATAVGERRSYTLSDGSRLVLNTNSRVRVALGSRVRQVALEKGQARFEVAHDASRPFIVRAGEKQIVATGTAFDVRWTDDHLSVVLVEGHLAILPLSSPPTAAALRSAPTLEAGQRLEFESPVRAIKSRVRVDREEAWVTGRVVFESTRLDAAVAEINRYASRPIEVADPALGSLLISGTFSVDDSHRFAGAVADVFKLTINDTPTSIVLGSSSDSARQ
jgi:transmembrane sensor